MGEPVGVSIEGAFAEKLGLVSHQNAVPLIRSLTITNDGDEDFADLTLELEATLPFAAMKTWPVDRLETGAVLDLPDRDIKLAEGYLADLTENVRAGINVRLRSATVILAEQHCPVELLAPNEWGGAGSMAELLPAFCTPNDPAVDKVLKLASDALRRAGRPDGIDGYEAKSRGRAWELASAIYSAICGLRLSYAIPPASFEERGQKIRTPSQILAGGVATCLDTALLFAAAIEQAGLNPILVLVEGHAFCGAWLQPQQFAQVLVDDSSTVRKRVDLNELVVFETTFATQAQSPAFSQAVRDATRRLADDRKFVAAVDVRRARMQKLRPLSVSAGAAESSGSESEAQLYVALEAAPPLPSFDVEAKEQEQPATPADKLDAWQRKLLDLTTRNRLLHLPRTAKAIWLVCPQPGRVEDLLAAHKTLRIAAMPRRDIGGRDNEIYAARHGQSLDEEYARQALERMELLSVMDQAKLDSYIIDLYRKSRADLEEGGSNTLFLAIGFLRWKKSEKDPKPYDAPLILLPVRLDRSSVRHPVRLTMLDDEPQFNQTLLELLRHDFNLEVPELQSELPSDDSGIDITEILTTMRRAVRDMPGFEVVPDVALSTFSFAKYLMWRDLRDRTAELMQHGIVQHLLQHKFGEAGPYAKDEFLRESELDQRLDPVNLFLPLPVDSSQLAAVIASASGKSFVLDGPPGTGKSQTIANMIAHNLALGRRVLFVAEKRAALDVVKRRLEQKGLGEFCLELHSNKASKVEVLQQLDRTWGAQREASASAWQATAGRVRSLRDELNALVVVLHRRHPNGWSLFEAMAEVIRNRHAWTPELSWPAGIQHSQDQIQRLREVSTRLDLTRATVERVGAQFKLLRHSDWSNAWQDGVVAAARNLLDTLSSCSAACEAFSRCTSLGIAPSMHNAGNLCLVGKMLAQAYGVDLRFAFEPSASRVASTLDEAAVLLHDYEDAKTRLSRFYAADSIARIDVAAARRAWQEASGKLWPFALMEKRRIAKALDSSTTRTKPSAVEADLQQIETLQTLLAGVNALTPVLDGVPGWAGIDTDMAHAKAVACIAEGLRSALVALAETPEHFARLCSEARRLVCDTNELLAAGSPVMQAADQLKQCHEQLLASLDHFDEVTGRATDSNVTDGTLQAGAQAIIDHTAVLHDWCSWQKVRSEAIELGLAPLVDAIESGAVPQDNVKDTFKTAYAYWFARAAMDAEPLLRAFVPTVQQNAIQSYRVAIDELSALTSAYIRAQLMGEIPSKQAGTLHAGFQILRHELQKKRRHKPVRQLLQEMGDDFMVLAPCMLMSPLSIAQYLPTDHTAFDVVIFDEASQVTPWDAIGAIGRAKQVIVAGDPKQMPPTNFFNRGVGVEDDVEEDMESILNECLAAGLPEYRLTWHYRSRHESLIAFSNHAYYDDSLVTFPAPDTRPSAVSWRRVAGVYARGTGRYNQIEAKAVVAELVGRLTDPAFVASGQSVGVITLNAEQQQLISDLLDQARREAPQIEPFFSENQPEPLIVKNLETVQGDERDLVVLSIGFGPSEPGAVTMLMNFGPLNKTGGERRLNVAVTRARREMMVFTSFDPTMIDLSRTSARAVSDLRQFVEFADHGPAAIAAAVKGSLGGYESPFEQYVAEAMRERGWQIHTQIGVSRFRIDLAVVHPDRPGDYLVGIECDGATYHSAATARDRDKVRADILRDYGWRLLRVWSTAWWVDRETEIGRLHQAITNLLVESRAEDAKCNEKALVADERSVEATADASNSAVTVDTAADLEDVDWGQAHAIEEADEEERQTESRDREPLVANSSEALALRQGQQVYRQADLSAYETMIDPDRFYLPEYDTTLSNLITAILESEAPILDELLVKRVARLHGFKRAGSRIRERVLDLARHAYFFQTDIVAENARFVWLSEDDIEHWASYRTPESEEAARSAEEIPREELLAAAYHVVEGDIALGVARTLGIRRLSQSARRRIEDALRG